MKVCFKIFLVGTFLVLLGCSPQVVQPIVYEKEKPDNIILMIGDGMGVAHLTAYQLQTGSDLFKDTDNVGLVHTYCADNLVTDSGASATAIATGYKALYNSVGRDQDGIPRPSIIELANEQDMLTGIVTTSSILDATPAAFYAHQDNRYFIDSISKDLMESEVDILIGGGKQFFDGTMEGSPYTLMDFRKRGRAVSHIWSEPIYQWDVSGNGKKIYFSGLESPMLHGIGFDHLKNASNKALEYFRGKNKNFFLMVEGAQIDWASHAGKKDELFLRMEGFEKAIRKMLDFAAKDRNTLVIITADHATGGLSIVDGSKHKDLKIDFSTNGHTAGMVPVFAYGPGAELFRGVMDNTDIFKKMAYLLDLVPKKTTDVSAN